MFLYISAVCDHNFQRTTLLISKGHRFKKVSVKTMAWPCKRMIGHPINGLLNIAIFVLKTVELSERDLI